MKFSRSMPTLVTALMTSIVVAACGASDPGGPIATATLSGIVTAATGVAIEGASVRIGDVTATTGADGRFELRNLPVGSATIVASAPRFDGLLQVVSLNPGANTQDVVLTPRTIFTYQNVVAYLPPDKAAYEAAIVFLPGLGNPPGSLDSRGLVRGTVEETCSIWCGSADRLEVRRRALELVDGNVALIGTMTLLDNAASHETLLRALSELSVQSHHPELATIPLFFVGHSMGGCAAYGFTRLHDTRVAGFITMKGACHYLGPAAAAADVPGYFLIGGADAPYRRENITAVFDAGRAAGAPWAVSIDPFDHRPMMDFDLMFGWIDAVLTARLPATAGAPLRAMAESAGWLGNRSTGAISTYACYGSARNSASWLPSREAALHWQRMAGGTVIVSAC